MMDLKLVSNILIFVSFILCYSQHIKCDIDHDASKSMIIDENPFLKIDLKSIRAD